MTTVWRQCGNPQVGTVGGKNGYGTGRWDWTSIATGTEWGFGKALGRASSSLCLSDSCLQGLVETFRFSHAPLKPKQQASCAAAGREHAVSERPAGGFPCSGPDLLSDLPTLLRFVASVNTLPCEVICQQRWGGFAPKGILAPPTPANIIHSVSSSDKNGFVPLKHEYQKYVLVTEVCGDRLSRRWVSEGQFLFGFQYFAYPLRSTAEKWVNKNNQKRESYTSKCTNQFPQFCPVS